MKLKIAILVIAYSCSVSAQGTFQNLNFEQANPTFVNPTLYPTYVTAASALPDWTVTIGGVQQTQITENNPATGSTWVTLIGPGGFSGFGPFYPIDGNYSVLLQGGGIPGAAAISQTGLIPTGTQTLLFEAQPPMAPSPAGPLDVLVGTQEVPITAVGTGSDYTLYAANISAWANQTEELTFSVPSYSGNWEIDDISFSPTTVTSEPSPLALTGIGAVLFALYRRFAPKRP